MWDMSRQALNIGSFQLARSGVTREQLLDALSKASRIWCAFVTSTEALIAPDLFTCEAIRSEVSDARSRWLASVEDLKAQVKLGRHLAHIARATFCT